MLKSMTGFSRVRVDGEAHEVVVEIRTVNHRYLDIRTRGAAGLTTLDKKVRDQIGESLGRGKPLRMTPPATQAEIEQMYTVLEGGLARIDFFSAREAATVLRTLRMMIGRAEPSQREVKLVQAIGYQIQFAVRQFDG